MAAANRVSSRALSCGVLPTGAVAAGDTTDTSSRLRGSTVGLGGSLVPRSDAWRIGGPMGHGSVL